MNRTFYKKETSTKGRVKYIPTHEYDSEWSYAMPEGCHLIVVKPGSKSLIYKVDPDTITLMAAFKLIKNDFVSMLLKSSELAPEPEPLTEEQRAAWVALQNSFDGKLTALRGPSLNEIADKFGELILHEAEELLKNPTVKHAWDKFQTIAVLSK